MFSANQLICLFPPFANQNAQKTIENQEKMIFDLLRKQRLIQGPQAVKENNSHEKLVLQAIISFSEQSFAFSGRRGIFLELCRVPSQNITVNRRYLRYR